MIRSRDRLEERECRYCLGHGPGVVRHLWSKADQILLEPTGEWAYLPNQHKDLIGRGVERSINKIFTVFAAPILGTLCTNMFDLRQRFSLPAKICWAKR
ncbi:hypothetical protein V8C42DRAFT_314159 [Trichoderma barbatum]